ncbi:MAG: hypothetical protein ACJ8C4_05335 [Gemmataceae bacterium]
MRLLTALLIFVATAAGPAPASTTASFAAACISSPLASYEWSWDGFKHYWRGQFGKTSGVVGLVVGVVGVGVLFVMSARRRD